MAGGVCALTRLVTVAARYELQQAGLETTMSKSARRLQGITGFAELALEIQADELTSPSCAAGQCDGGESHRHHEGSEQTHSGMIPPAWHALMVMPTVFFPTGG